VCAFHRAEKNQCQENATVEEKTGSENKNIIVPRIKIVFIDGVKSICSSHCTNCLRGEFEI